VTRHKLRQQFKADPVIFDQFPEHLVCNVVPADNKWFTHLVVAAAIAEALEELGLSFPKVDAAKRKELQEARETLAKK